MLDLFIRWSVSPEAFGIGDWTVRWYGILYGCAFIFSYYAFRELLKYDKSLPGDIADRALIYMILGTIIGARVGDCFFYHPHYYLEHPLEIVAIWKGGLSSHGGAIGILTVLYLFARKLKKPYIWVLDRVVVVIGVAGFFIRLGNLMNSEIYGIQTGLPWGFIFESRGETLPKHPTQIYEALYYLLTYTVLRCVFRKSNNTPRPYLIFGLFLIMVFVFRFCIEFIKNPQEDFEEAMRFNMGQWLSVPFIILGIASLVITGRQKKEEPVPVPVNNPPRPKPNNTPNNRNNKSTNSSPQKKKHPHKKK
jgi:prolipoprotein diacylglyceryl transferase